jgi:L-alanine-DL-glutamate epimerase-like enolase superfamily enzyme
MRITGIETILLGDDFPPAQIQRWNGGAIRGWTVAFVRIHAEGGLSGLGEAYFGGFVPRMIPPAVDDLGKLLLDEDATRIGYLWRKLNHVTRFWNRHGFGKSVIAAIDIALHDLVAKALHVPVYQLLGGLCHPRMRTYASGGCSDSLEVLISELGRARNAGFQAFKWRLVDPLQAKYLMSKLREEAGPDFDLMVDLVQGSAPQPWSRAAVLDVARAIEPYRPFFLEEPFPIDDKDSYRELRARVNCSIAGGEGVSSVEEARAFLQGRAVDVLQPDATIAGGLTQCRTIAALALAEHIDVVMHSWGAAASQMANLHFSLANQSSTLVEYCHVPSTFRENLFTEPLRIVNGAIEPPRAEGLGIELSDDVINRYEYRESGGHQFHWDEHHPIPVERS